MTIRLTPARLALSYISLGVLALALLAVPVWYGFQANVGAFRSYVPVQEMERLVGLFNREGPQAVAAAVDAYSKSLPPDQIAIFVGPQKQRLAGNLPRWPAEVPDEPGIYAMGIDMGGGATMRVVTSHVALPGGYLILMGRESVRFESMVALFWYSIAGALAIVLSLGVAFGLLLRRAHGQLERLVAHRTAALQLSEERYSMAMEASEEGYIDVNVDTGEFVTSERLNEIFGIAPGTRFSGRSDFLKQFRFYGNDGENYLQTIRAIEADGGPDRYQLEFRIRLSAGKVRWIWTRGKVMRDAEGRARRRVGVFVDVTERRLAAEALRASEERYGLAMEASEEGHFDWNVLTDDIFVSAHLKPVLGLPPESEYRTRNDLITLMSYHPDDRRWLEEMARSTLAGPAVRHEFEYRILRDGETRWIRARWKIFRDAAGAAMRVIGVVTDITDHKRAADELRASEARYARVLEASDEGIWEWRPATDELFVSERARQLWGIPDGVTVRTHVELKRVGRFHPDDVAYTEEKIAASRAPGAGGLEMEYRVINSAGEVRWLRSRGKMFFDDRGAPSRMTGSISDITERRLAAEEMKAMERKLRQAQRLEAMGTLAGGIAHDFNNILGAILGFGEMAMRDAPKGSRLWRDLECIVEAGDRGRALVDRVLAFSRSSVGERVPVHVEKVVREALDHLSAKLPPDITLQAKLHAARAAIQGDATQVHQVVTNLVTNAIQAMTAGGMLRVSLHVERIEQTRAPTIGILAAAEYLVLQVADTGTGIAPEVLERMFDPFFTTKEVGTGTGLGLSIVHGIATELGGAIDVASTVGAGSTFTIYLPRAGDAVETEPHEKPSLPRGDGQRVLVVDDEEPLVRLATRTLEELGYAPVGFTSSRAALAAFRADPGRFDALITDERMPGMSGAALIRKVRGIRDGIPVVLMSGYVGDALARQAREAGAEEVLRKPLSARDLATSLARVLYS